MNSKQETQVKIFGALLETNISELQSCINLVHSSLSYDEGILDATSFYNMYPPAVVLEVRELQKDIQKMDDQNKVRITESY